jgi:hypothetical protein
MQWVVDVLLEKPCRRERFRPGRGRGERLVDCLGADFGRTCTRDEVADQVAETEVVGACRCWADHRDPERRKDCTDTDCATAPVCPEDQFDPPRAPTPM